MQKKVLLSSILVIALCLTGRSSRRANIHIFGRKKLRVLIFMTALLIKLHFLPVFLRIFGFHREENDGIY